MPTSEFPGRLSRLSRRVSRLGSGVFARNDQRKNSYRLAISAGANDRPPLLDLSLGSTDLLPPAAAIEAIRRQFDLKVGDAMFFIAGRPGAFYKFAGEARNRVGRELGTEEEAVGLGPSDEITSAW